MMDDEDVLPVDLEAWQPPAPSPGLADAVIARMREPVAAGAVEPEARTRRRWWIGAAALAAVGAVATAVIVMGARHDAPTHGEVVATRAQHVELGVASADLEAGTEIRWRRDGEGLHVDQPRGAAAWRIDGDEHVRIDAGAAVASVEATGGSLRVEVYMNLSDVRLTGISAVTAAAVALVTVTVYEGRVKAIGGGQSVTIEPGASVEIRPGEPVGAPVVGMADQLKRALAEADELRRSLAAGATTKADLDAVKRALEQLRAQVAGGSATVPPVGCDEVSCVLNDYEGACCATYKQAATPLDKAVIDGALRATSASIATCFRGHAATSLMAHFDIVPAGTASNTVVEIEHGPADNALIGCVTRVVASVRFPKSTVTTKVNYPFVFESPATTSVPPCDADALKRKGDSDHQSGLYAQALANYEKALACKPELDLYPMLAMEACKSKNVAKAKRYARSLSSAQRNTAKQQCLANGIELVVEDAPACDADALKLKADSDHQSGLYAQALVNYEKAMACKPGWNLVPQMAMESCKSKNVTMARKYFRQLSPSMQNVARQQCLASGIDLAP